MAEYIEREKVLIAVNKFYHDPKVDIVIRSVPAADVAEVVRCKDCKRCFEKRTKRNNQLMRFCMRMDGREFQVNANDFCSFGERKPASKCGECRHWHISGHCKLIGPHIHKKYGDYCSK